MGAFDTAITIIKGLLKVILAYNALIVILIFIWFFVESSLPGIIALIMFGLEAVGIIVLIIAAVLVGPELVAILAPLIETFGGPAGIARLAGAQTAGGHGTPAQPAGAHTPPAAGHGTETTPTVSGALSIKIIFLVIATIAGFTTTTLYFPDTLGFILLAVIIAALLFFLVFSEIKKKRTQTPGSAAHASTPVDYVQFIKQLLLVSVIAGGLYMFITKLGLSGNLTIIISITIAGFVIGMLRGNAVCVLLLWTCAFLFAEAIAFIAFQHIPGQVYFTLLAFFLIILFAFIAPRIGGRHTFLVGILVLLTTLILGFLALGTNTFRPYLSDGSQLQKSFNSFSEAFGRTSERFGTNLPALFERGQLSVQRQINIATGDYEEGVEAQSTKQLGVFLENLGLTESRVPKDGVVDLYARLRAESFTTTQAAAPLLITIQCKDEKSGKIGSIRPQDTFTIEEYEVFDIDCLFDAKELATGANTLSLEATFDFTTSAFLKSYFMEQETIRTYRRQQQDPLDAFQITDKKPPAIYTPGPMRIGMNAGQQPLALVTDRPEGPTLTLTIERDWLDGELLELNELAITAPPGLAIDRISGQPPTDLCSRTITQEHTCILNTPFISRIITNLSRPFTTIRITTKKEDPAKILGGAPLSIRSFKTDIRYKYRIKKTHTVYITETPSGS